MRLTGPGDCLLKTTCHTKENQNGLEIDSDEITYFIADHQDKLDTIEIMMMNKRKDFKESD